MKEAFQRYQPLMRRSFALRSFNQAETEINRHFWSFKVISDYSRYIASDAKKKDPNAPTAKVFKATAQTPCEFQRLLPNGSMLEMN
jgi:hypothetical protein